MKPRIDGSIVVSLALHVAIGAGLLYVLSVPYPVRLLLERRKIAAAPVERIGFIVLPQPGRGVTTAGRSGGDGRPLTAAPEAPLRAPPAAGVPALPPPPLRKPNEYGSGPLVGRGGAVEGIVPSYADPRLWVAPGAVEASPRSISEQLDSALVAGVQRVEDSVRLAGSGRKAGDWTVTKNGRKYGWDTEAIHLGSISIPNAILALPGLLGRSSLGSGLGQANPIATERERVIRGLSADINYHAQKAMNEDEFREAVKRIRQRKERERNEMRDRRKVIASP